MTTTLATINTAAAALLQKVGWTQGIERNAIGRMCLTGALRYCDPQPGDFRLACEVYRRLKHGEAWNDNTAKNEAEVIGYLLATPITDELLAVTFGPQWQQIVALVRRAAVLTSDEAASLDAARGAAGDAARALIVRDLLLTTEKGRRAYTLLTRPWAAVIGPVHPGDLSITSLTESDGA